MAVGYPVFRGLAEPQHRADIVRFAVHTFGIEDGKIVHRFGVSFAGGDDIEFVSGDQVLFNALSLFEHTGIAELRWWEAFVCGTLQPLGGFVEICGYASAFHEAHGDLVGSGRVSGRRGVAQTCAADGTRQAVRSRRLRNRGPLPGVPAVCRRARIVPVTSLFAAGGPTEGVFNKGGLSSADKLLPASIELRSDWTGSPLGVWGAGVKLGSVGGASSVAVTSTSAAVCLLACSLLATLSFSPLWSWLEPAVGSGSKLAATLVSVVSKIPKLKILLVTWTNPTTIATMLAASRADLIRVDTFARSGTSSDVLKGSERA